MVKKEDEINELLLDLCILASNFSSLLPEHEREKAAGKYREALEKLYATGWDDVLEMHASCHLNICQKSTSSDIQAMLATIMTKICTKEGQKMISRMNCGRDSTSPCIP